MWDEIWEMKPFEQQAERVVKEVKIFEDSEFENGEDDCQCVFPVFGAKETEKGLPQQEEGESPVESGVEDITCYQKKTASVFGRQA